VGKSITRTIGSLGLPLLVLAAMVAFAQSAVWTESLGSVSEVLPHVITLFAVGIGLRFNRSRVVLAAVVLALADWALANEALSPVVAASIAILAPLAIAGLSALRERGLTTTWGMATMVAVAVPIGLVPWLAQQRHAELAALLDSRVLPNELTGISLLPEPALIAGALAVLLVLITLFWRRSALDSAFACAVFAVLAGLEISAQGSSATPFFASASLVMVVAVVQESYGFAYIDELTKIPGRRALNETLLGLGRNYTVAMLDIDHFKKFNDKYGHDVGDQVLRLVASKLRKVGGGGKAFRYGGEEFTIVFSGKSGDDCLDHLENVRKAVETARLTLRAKDRPTKKPKTKPTRKPAAKKVSVTISIGVATRSKKAKKPGTVMEAADKALYRAKKKGRNQVCK